MNNVLSCYFPTTVILVDDDIPFLICLRDILEDMNINLKSFDNPAKALEYINDTSSTNKLDYSDLIKDGDESTSDCKSILLNISSMHHEIYSSDRFTKISVVVSDYSLPVMNGVDLCSNVNDRNIQRILLTGIVDDKKAIEAFNNGYITRFLKKDSDNFASVFYETVKKSIYQYFKPYTNYVSKHISALEVTHLNDPIFADFFFKFCKQNTYIEDYMLDECGSYLFLDAVGNTSLLSVVTENELCRLIEIGIQSEEIEQEVLDKLRSRKYMLVSHNRIGTLPPIAEWSKYLYPSTKLDGYQTYYYAISAATPDLDFDKIVSFNTFKKSQKMQS